MICEKLTSKECVFRMERKDIGHNAGRFLVPLLSIPENPVPKKIVLYHRWGDKIRTWEMSWNKFLDCNSIGNVGFIEVDEMKYSESKVKQ